MFFLVPYNIIDREDITLNQKMLAIYLARMQDEFGSSFSLDKKDIAPKLRLSEEEVALSLGVLLSKGILSAEQVGIKEHSFVELTDSEEEPAKAAEEEDEEADDAKNQSKTEDVDLILDAAELAEERVRERAARLKLNVRKKKRSPNQDANLTHIRRHDDIKLSEEEKAELLGQDEEADKLLKLLQEDPKEEKITNQRIPKADISEAKSKNRAFMKVSSVYNSVKSTKSKSTIDEITPK